MSISAGTGCWPESWDWFLCRNRGCGMVNAAIIRTTPYQVSIPKDGGKLSSLKIVLAADLHLGYSVERRR